MRGAVDSGGDVEERRLTRAVGTNQAKNFVRLNGEIETVERDHAAEFSSEAACFQ